MSKPENAVLVYLRRIDEKVDGLGVEMRDIKVRPTMVEERLASVEMSIAGVNRRVDRIESRLDRIERRLDHVDAPQ